MEETLEGTVLDSPVETLNNTDQPMLDSSSNPTRPTSESGGSSDSDSEEEEDEAQQNLQLKTLESELSTNTYNYDAHVQYIKLLRKISDIEKLRKAREAMSEIFPLSPAMWQEWAKDEASISTRPEAVAGIVKLYERGVSDYMSVPLWCEYLNFIQQYDTSVQEFSAAELSRARDLFERALTAAGLHFSEGSKIWEAYREFEQAILQSINETDVQAKEKQAQRIRSIFHRQLSLPLVDMKLTLETYKAWEVEQGNVLDLESNELDGISSQVASAYRKALDNYSYRIKFEEQVSRNDISDAERLHQFMVYLKFEQSSGDPARVQVLYERAITEFPISSDLWVDYTSYIDRTLKVGSILRNVYSRATKNCPWVGEIWIRYLLALERTHASEKEIDDAFEKSLQCTFSSLDEYKDIFLTRIDGLRRRISFSAEGDDVLDYSFIRETFQRASDYLSPHLKNTMELLRLYAYWAHLELNLGKDLVVARGVWESLIKICGSMVEAWQGYIAMEIELNHINEARSIYKRCYSKRLLGTGSEDICHSWLRFEREFGTLEDFDHAARKVNPRLEELQSFKLQQEGNAGNLGIPLKQNTREKRKSSSDVSNEQSPAKRQKSAAQKPKKLNEKEKAQAKSLSEPAKSEQSKADTDKPEGINDQDTKTSALEKPKVYRDQCTAFISNIDLQANDEHLRDFFSDVGGVVAVRILLDKFTKKSRGLAYVDFSDEAHLTQALAKNKKMLLGKKLSIARSNPKSNRKDSAASSRGFRKAGETSSKDDNIQLTGKNTFAVPRNVKPLGHTVLPRKTDEEPKSNDEFRKMFING